MNIAAKQIPTLVAAIAALLLTVPGADATGADRSIELLEQTGKAFTHVARKATPAVVFIQVEKVVETGMRHPQQFNDPFGFFGDDFLQRFFHHHGQPRRRFRQQGAGSGFIITKDGYILTNSHVVGDADRIRVKLHDGREFDAKRIGSDDKSEVAVIKIDAEDLPTVALGDSSKLEVGEWVVAVGNPFGLTETVTAGIVSALGRNNIGIADYENFIQTDAAINPGNSGGPLLNIKGEVIGINTAIYSQSGGYMGVGFAIPINMAESIKDQLVKSGRVTRGYLGVYLQEVTPDLAETFDLDEADGILIADVEEDSAADEAGLKQGDVIIALDGRDVSDIGAFRNEISSNPPGTEMTLTILRKGKRKQIEVETRALPGEDLASDAVDEIYEQLGLEIGDVTAELSDRLGYDLNEGVVIVGVAPGGRASQAGLRPGALITGVNLERVRSVAEFNEALDDSRDTGRVVLGVKVGRYHQYIAIRLD
jgi:serine protease Do